MPAAHPLPVRPSGAALTFIIAVILSKAALGVKPAQLFFQFRGLYGLSLLCASASLFPVSLPHHRCDPFI